MASFKQLIHEIHRRSLWQVLLIYIGAAWFGFEIVDAITERLTLPDWLPVMAIILFIVGLPVVLATAVVQEGGPSLSRADPTLIHGADQPAGPPAAGARRLLTWRNAISGGVLALALWGIVAAAWLLVAGGEEESYRAMTERPSIAALPFDNRSGREEDRYFTDGVHDEILAQLSKFGGLSVRGRTSVMQYRDSPKNLREISRELDARYVLEGGVQRAGETVRITVQLIDAERDEHVWAETYDRDLTAANIFAIQSEIATAVARALRATLSAQEQARLARVPTENIDALEAYFLGRQLLEERTSLALSAAAEYFQRAIDLDSDFALAYSGLADAYMLLPEYSATIDRNLAQEISESAARRALSLDPDLPEVLTSMGWNRLIHDYDWKEAERLLRRALQVQANNSGALHWLSHVLSWQGQHTEARELARRAVDVDPLSTLMHANLSYIYMDAGEFDTAISIAHATLEQDPNYPAHMRNVWLTYLRAGRPEEAAGTLQEWAAATGRDVEAAEAVGRLFVRYQQTGEPAHLSADLVARLELGSEDLAQVYAFVGDAESALDALDQAYRERSGSRSVLSIKINPGYDFIRDDPRFVDLLNRVGLEP
jgi:TolB-like protein